MFALSLVVASNKLDKKLPNGAKVIISQAERSDVFAVNVNLPDSSTDQKTNMQKSQCNKHGPTIVHSIDCLMSFYPDCFTRLDIFQDKAFHIELDPSIPPKSPCRSMSIHQHIVFEQELAKMQPTGISKPVDYAIPWVNRFAYSKKQLGTHSKPQLCMQYEPNHSKKTPYDIFHKLS